jgi:RND family efflux transporter MFP subunit
MSESRLMNAGMPRMIVPPPASRWKSRVLVPAAVFLLAGGLLAYSSRHLFTPVVFVQVAPVVTKEVAAASPSESNTAPSGPLVQAPGWIEPDPFAVSVPALVEGVVSEVLVRDGQRVEAGQVVARINDEELRLAARIAQATVEEKTADEHAAAAMVAPAHAALASATAQAEAMRDEVTRKKALVEAGGVSAGEYRRLELKLRSAEADVERMRGDVAVAERGVERSQAATRTAQAMLAEAELKVSRTSVKAATGGMVLAVVARPGMRLSMEPGAGNDVTRAGVVMLYDPEKLQARVDVPLADAAKVSTGTKAEITTEALPGVKFGGEVTRVVHEANIQRNTVQFKVRIEAPSETLKPEMLVRVRFNPGGSPGAKGTSGETGTQGMRMLIPTSSVLERQGESGKVWVMEPASGAGRWRAMRREVTLGEVDGDDVEVTRGLKPGDRVILNAPAGLKDGVSVKAMAPATPGASEPESTTKAEHQHGS